MKIATHHNLAVVEDVRPKAHAVSGAWQHQVTWERSFHETKNVISGEGGALLLSTHKTSCSGAKIQGKGHQSQPLPSQTRSTNIRGRTVRVFICWPSEQSRSSMGSARGKPSDRQRIRLDL